MQKSEKQFNKGNYTYTAVMLGYSFRKVVKIINSKYSEIGSFLVESAVQLFFLLIPLLICISNLKWSPWYDPDNLMAFAIFNIFPFPISFYVLPLIIVPLIYITFKVKEINYKLVFTSITIYILLTGAINITLDNQKNLNSFKVIEYALNIGFTLYILLLIIFALGLKVKCLKNQK